MRQKTLILFACTLLLFLNGIRAQHSPWSVGATFGAAFPVGKFGGKNFFDSSQSQARMGPVLNFQLERRLISHFGVVLQMSAQENIVDIRSIENQLGQADTSSAYNLTTVSSGNWKIGKIMVGPGFSLPFGKKKDWRFTSRLMAGVIRAVEPKLSIDQQNDYIAPGQSGITSVHTEESAQSNKTLPWTFAYLASAGIRYPINERWSFRADLDYSAASAKLPFTFIHHGFQRYVFYSVGAGAQPVVIELPHNPNYSLPVATLNISVGLELRL